MAMKLSMGCGLRARPPPARRPGGPGRQLVVKASSFENRKLKNVQFKTKQLADSELYVADCCLGSMTWGIQNTEIEAHEQLHYSYEHGINMIDTAEIYPVKPSPETQGSTSTYIGSWLRARRIPRDSVVIASKVAGRSQGLEWVPANRTDPPGEERRPRVDPESIREACEGELRRLKTDYLDLFQIHWPDRYVPTFGESQYRGDREMEEAQPFYLQVEAMGQLVKEGKIRYWGLSNETSFGVMSHCQEAAQQGVPRPITIQNNFSLLNRSFESELAETCAPSNNNLGLLPWSAMAGGALSGKYLRGEKDPAFQRYRFNLFPGRYDRFNTERAQKAAAEYVAIAKECSLTPAQLAYAFCRSREFVPTTIIGATSMEQLEENLGGFGEPLAPEVLEAIDEVHVKMRNPALED